MPNHIMTTESILQELAMIGSVSAGGRLNHIDGRLYVQQASPFNGIYRRFFGESRLKTIQTIKELLRCVDERLADMSDRRLEEGRDNSELAYRVTSLCKALEQAAVGIKHLQATYVGDLSAHASLELLSERAGSILGRGIALRSTLADV